MTPPSHSDSIPSMVDENYPWPALEALGDRRGQPVDIWAKAHGVTPAQLGYMQTWGLVVVRYVGTASVVEITPRGRGALDYERMRTFLASIATAEPQSEQAGWMVATAKDGLRWKDGGADAA